MGFGDDDIPAFSADMGVDVTLDGVTVQGLLDETDAAAVTADGQVEGVVHGTTLTLSAQARAALEVAGLTVDSNITVDGRAFTVRDFLRVDDGKFWHVMLAEVTP